MLSLTALLLLAALAITLLAGIGKAPLWPAVFLSVFVQLLAVWR